MRAFVLMSAALGLGCATSGPVKRPMETFELGAARASYRVFTDGSICEAEPRFLLDEFVSENEVLKRFLRETPGDADAEWTEHHFAVMEDGLKRLPDFLAVVKRHLSLVSKCSFANDSAWPNLRERSALLVDGVQARLDVGPLLMREVRQRNALAVWRQDRAEQQEAARRTCPARATPRIYFAWRDTEGVTSYLFCDGALVSEIDGNRRLDPPPAELVRRPPPAKVYLGAAEHYPAGAVMVPPPTPSKPRAERSR